MYTATPTQKKKSEHKTVRLSSIRDLRKAIGLFQSLQDQLDDLEGNHYDVRLTVKSILHVAQHELDKLNNGSISVTNLRDFKERAYYLDKKIGDLIQIERGELVDTA